jgi:hypothetical protein
MRADHFRDKRIETANQFASRLIIVPQGSRNQLSRVVINHVVVEIVSTLLTTTGVEALRLQVSWLEADKINVTDPTVARSRPMKQSEPFK